MSNITEQKPRLIWADIVKFWGILAIVLGHALESGAVRQYLYSFHVPLFFFVIGLYFKPSKLSFWRFSCKKAVSLLVPYFAFAMISILVFQFLGNIAASALDSDIAGLSLSANLLEMLTGQCRANRPLWFLPCMFVFYILCYGLTRFTEKMSIRVRTTTFILVIAVSVALCLLNSIVFKIDSLFWKIDVALFMLCFFLIAVLAKPFLVQRIKNLTVVLLAFFCFLLGGIGAFQNPAIEYLSNEYGNVLLFYISSICTILGFCFLSMVISCFNVQFINKALAYVGQRTLPILLMHKFPILFFQVLFPWTRQPLKNNHPIVSIVVAIISIVACLIVDKLWEKMIAFIVLQRKTNE